MQEKIPQRSFRALAAIGGVLALLCAGSGAAAQQASTPHVGLAFSDGSRQVTDVFVGRNAVGPYILSWKGIEGDSVLVTRDGRRLARDADYRLDASAGTLTFTAPLRTKQIARVDYRCASGKATANAAPVLPPLQFSLFERRNAMSLNALYRPDAGGGAATVNGTRPGLALLGFTGSAKPADGSALDSRMFLDLRGGNLFDRSAVQLNEKSKTRYGQLSAGFTRGGSGFAGGEETGIAAGKQVLEAAGSLNPFYGLTASASFNQTSELPREGRGATVTTLGQKLGGTLGATTRFQATRTDTTTDTGVGDSLERLAHRLQVDQRLGDRTSATALLEHTATTSGDSRAVVQTSALSVRSSPTDAITVLGSYQNRLLPSGAEDSTNLRVDAEATKQVKLSALFGEKYSAKGALHSRQATVEYTPDGRITLTGILMARAESGKEDLLGGFGVAARPVPFVEVSGGIRLRDEVQEGVRDPNAPDTYDLKLALRLLRNHLRLTGGYADNPEDEAGRVARARNRSLGLQTAWGVFDLTGGYTYQQEDLTDRVSTALDLRIGWRLAPTTQLVTGFRGTQTLEESLLLSDTYSLSLTHRLGSSFDLMLSGARTSYYRDGLWQPNPEYRADARLGLRF